MTKLHVDFVAEENVPIEAMRGEVITMSFHVETGRHVSIERQYRLALSARFSEHTAEQKLRGFQVDAQIVGFFKMSDDIAAEKLPAQIQLNGVNTLYGTLRGIILNTTGAFPTGPMVLKTQTAQQILGALTESAPPQLVKSKRKRKPIDEKAGVKSAQRVFGKVLEKADPKRS